MTTLTIKDLPVNEELGSAALAAVHGGNTPGQPIIGQNVSVFETDDKSSGANGKGGGTKTTSGTVPYLKYSLTDVVITG
jgi:hypothetical protein